MLHTCCTTYIHFKIFESNIFIKEHYTYMYNKTYFQFHLVQA
jgi:hypothetical protein